MSQSFDATNTSFSMAFNPIANVKTVREYENEVKQLKEEVFELRTQLLGNTSTNIPKILYEASTNTNTMKEEIKSLKTELDTASTQNKQFKEELQNVSDEKLALAKENNELTQKLIFLEDENKRLLNKLNKVQTNESQLRNIVAGIEHNVKDLSEQNSTFSQNISFYKNENNHLQNENEILRQNNYDLNGEVHKLQNELQNLNDKQNEIMNSFSCTNSSFNNIKLQLEKTINNQHEQIENYKKEVDALEKTKKTYITNLINFKNGMKIFKNITLEKLEEIATKVENVKDRSNYLTNKFTVNDPNKEYLKSKNISSIKNINELIKAFADRERKIKKKVEESTTNSINSIREQIKEAMGELNVCREYMQKKAVENKELKKSNAKLQNEANKIKKQLDTAKQYYSGLTSKYGEMVV